MLGLLLLAVVLWIALGLDRSRRRRLYDRGRDLAGHHRHRAVPHHRRLRRDRATPSPLIGGLSRAMAQHEEPHVRASSHLAEGFSGHGARTAGRLRVVVMR